MPQPRADMLRDHPQAEERATNPQSTTNPLAGALGQLTTTLTNTVGIVTGLLGSVASSVDPENLRPEPGYTFQAPGPNDSRGPCPGLNLLANYGYL